MEQKVEMGRTHGSIREFGKVLVFALFFTFVLEGVLFISVLIYSLVFYRFVTWI